MNTAEQSGWNVVAGPSIQVASGGYLDLEDPDTASISVRDIAHALSNLCRYTGHVRRFYSVAQHATLCARNAPTDDRWAVLMHDAAEAYIGDVSRPLKALLPDYRRVEKRIEDAIALRFGIVGDETVIRRLDREALATERRDLMPDTGEPWAPTEGFTPWPTRIEPWSPERAYNEFVIEVLACGMGRELDH